MSHRSRYLRYGALVLIVAGLWSLFVPFSRPVPGGTINDLERTPEAHCGSTVLDALRGDATATALVHENPRAFDTDPRVEVEVECSTAARWRSLIALTAVAAGAAALLLARRWEPAASLSAP